MKLKLGMTGMDGPTQAALTEAFHAANQSSGNRFELSAAGNEADFVIVDMDSLYGPMSFMQLHNAGKHVIGYTQAPRTQSDSRLARPLDPAEFSNLLGMLADQRGAQPVLEDVQPEEPMPEPTPAAVVVQQAVVEDVAPLESAPPAGTTPAPKQQDHLPPSPAVTVAAPHPVAEAQPLVANVVPEPVHHATLADWLVAGALKGPVAFQRGDGPELRIHPVQREYQGPTGLKPLIAYFDAAVAEHDLRALADGDWQAGTAQPLTRLVWLAGLLAGNGRIVAGLPDHAHFQLTKWPQTEREYPKHFRIATAMMKGPATVEQIAEAASVPASDVADFVNANLATGFATASVDGVNAPAPGILGALRG
ncbi:hypothetical protein [Solilutibacter silvestris]|uniref:Uncharacterized protein n=1 Tax=Solilutibacter silvestris TaxID=1645665 RepID=A0A2K1PXY0_9GAMM|nr:hypothetical protein [Lysobacter silvestris]PNS07646.1 hypothetical protein Lysil_1822 [Lysobacter silvestris]